MNAHGIFTRARSFCCVPIIRLFHRYGFRKISWLVYVATARNGGIIRQKLERNHCEQWNQHFVRLRNLDDMIGVFFQFRIRDGSDANNDGVARFDLFDIRQGFFVNALLRRNGDNRQAVHDQCERTML